MSVLYSLYSILYRVSTGYPARRLAACHRAYATQYDTAQLVLAVLLTAPGCKDG